MQAVRTLNQASLASRAVIGGCSPVASTSSARSFTTTASLCESKRKRKARLIRKANLAKKAELTAAFESSQPDIITGYAKGNEHLWDNSLLKGILLTREQVWGTVKQPDHHQQQTQDESATQAAAAAEAGRVPELLNFGITKDEADKMANSMPLVAARRHFWQEDFSRSSASASSSDVMQRRIDEAEEEEFAKRDRLMRIIDLKNANAQGIQLVNTKRIVEAFGSTPDDSGRPEVQAAILTVKIRQLLAHLIGQPRDVINQRALRNAVKNRATVLKYLKSVDVKRYDECLKNIGVEARAVEGELNVTRELLRSHIRPNEYAL